MENTSKKLLIGRSDYTRKQMESGDSNGGWGTTTALFLKTISLYEKDGYTVKFETNLFRKIFGVGIYKVIAYKN